MHNRHFHTHTHAFLWLMTAVLLTACVSSGRSIPAPVEDMGQPQTAGSGTKPKATSAASAKSITTTQADAGAKPGYYTVKSGDTLIKIGLDHGQNWRDIMRWNAIENPNLIEVGQVLRVSPSADHMAEEVVVKPVTPPGNLTSSATESKNTTAAASPNSNTPRQSAEASDEVVLFSWPVPGNVLAAFDDAKNKGIDISGKSGEPVLASADGKVVYAGSGLRGYGNLVILKHNNTFLTAYAHNQSLAVKEDQWVKRGQKIAEMGNSDADVVKLHFEIRKMGKPVDPLKLLTPR